MTPEGQIKNQICEYLSLRKDVFFWVQESQGTFDSKRGIFRKKNSKYQMNGIPDILCMVKIGTLPPIFVGLEVKSKKGSQTDSQKQFEKAYKSFGGPYFVVRSPEETKDALIQAIAYIKGQIPIRTA